MRSSIILGLALILTVTATALAGHRGRPKLPLRGKPQLVGVTTTTHTGDQGVLAFNAACAADFGDGARICTSKEIIMTSPVPTLPDGSAWVHPLHRPHRMTNSFILDYSGVQTATAHPGQLSCEGWQNGSSHFGLVMVNSASQLGTFSIGNCGAARAVACCQ